MQSWDRQQTEVVLYCHLSVKMGGFQRTDCLWTINKPPGGGWKADETSMGFIIYLGCDACLVK